MEVVAGADNARPGGVGIFDQFRQIGTGREKFNVDQVGTVGIENRMEKAKICFMIRRSAAALGLCAQRYEQQLLL